MLVSICLFSGVQDDRALWTVIQLSQLHEGSCWCGRTEALLFIKTMLLSHAQNFQPPAISGAVSFGPGPPKSLQFTLFMLARWIGVMYAKPTCQHFRYSAPADTEGAKHKSLTYLFCASACLEAHWHAQLFLLFYWEMLAYLLFATSSFYFNVRTFQDATYRSGQNVFVSRGECGHHLSPKVSIFTYVG